MEPMINEAADVALRQAVEFHSKASRADWRETAAS
jgi:hypothetical protein